MQAMIAACIGRCLLEGGYGRSRDGNAVTKTVVTLNDKYTQTDGTVMLSALQGRGSRHGAAVSYWGQDFTGQTVRKYKTYFSRTLSGPVSAAPVFLLGLALSGHDRRRSGVFLPAPVETPQGRSYGAGITRR